MNRRQALETARKILEDNRIENPSLEGEILLRHVLGIDRALLFSYPEKELKASQERKFTRLLERRRNGEPSAYITGHKEFYGLDFIVNKHVLIPRPETELLVEKAIGICSKYGFTKIADVGTGSGCIAISLVKNLPRITVYAIDTSLKALKTAEENSRRHKVKSKLKLLHGNLLEPLDKPVDLIAANLPYVKKHEITSKYEPEMALNGGIDGLDRIKELCGQVKSKLKPHGFLLVEIGQGQTEELKPYLHNMLPKSGIEAFKDLAGIERVISLRLTP